MLKKLLFLMVQCLYLQGYAQNLLADIQTPEENNVWLKQLKSVRTIQEQIEAIKAKLRFDSSYIELPMLRGYPLGSTKEQREESDRKLLESYAGKKITFCKILFCFQDKSSSSIVPIERKDVTAFLDTGEVYKIEVLDIESSRDKYGSNRGSSGAVILRLRKTKKYKK
jgi:hypothetical protein